MTILTRVLVLADAPNPRFCPHHNCGTNAATVLLFLWVAIFVIGFVLLFAFTVWYARYDRKRLRAMLARYPDA